MKPIFRRIQAVAFAAAAVALASASIAYACAALATLAVPDEPVPARGEITGTGAGFNGRHHADTGQQIEIKIRWDSLDGPVVWSGLPTEDGAISFSFLAPHVKPGYYSLIAEQLDPVSGNSIFGTPARQSVEISGKGKSGKGAVALIAAPDGRDGRDGAAVQGTGSGTQLAAWAERAPSAAPAVALVALAVLAGVALAASRPSHVGAGIAALSAARSSRAAVAAMGVAALSATFLPAAAPARAADGALRVSANQRVGSDPEPARGKAIPGVAVHPDNPDHMVVTEQDFYDGRCEFTTTFDGGDTWTTGRLEAPAGFEGPAACFRFDSGDYAHTNGSVAFGSGQNVYTTFSWNRPGEADSVLVARSTDGGRTFETAVVAIPDMPRANTDVEGTVRPRLTVVPDPAGDRVYVAAWRLTIQGPFVDHERRVLVARSDDGGQTWSHPVDAQDPAEKAREQSQPVVGPNGDVYVAWRRQNLPDNSLVVARSSDLGATWHQTVVGPVAGSRDSHPTLAVDATNGRLYVAYQDRPFAPSSRENDVFLRSSADGGVTWSAPVRISDDDVGNGVDQRLPQVAVAPNGRVDVVWHDRRFAYLGQPGAALGPPVPGARGQADIMYAYSTDGGQTLSANRRVTDRIWSLDYGLDTNVLTSFFYPPAIASDDEQVVVTWSDSREGGFDTGTTDVYIAHVRHHPTGPLPDTSVGAYRGPSFGVPLSEFAYPGGREGVNSTNLPLTRLVVVAEDDAGAALLGGVLARSDSGPVLVSPSGGVPAVVKQEVSRLQPVGAYLLGDDEALSPEVDKNLLDAGVGAEGVTRIAGVSPADTARLVAEHLDPRTPDQEAAGAPAFPAAVIVNPASAEAATVSALAAALRLPVLFVEHATLPQPTADALASLSIPATLVIGGPHVVSEAVLAELPSPTRLGGPDVAATSGAVAHEMVAKGLPVNVVYVADEDRPMDAAGAGAEVARNGGLLLVVRGADATAARTRLEELGLAGLADRLVVIR